VLLKKGVPKQEIKQLKAGDYYIDGVITFIQRKNNIVSFITDAGNLYNAHRKQGDYNLFRNDRYRRRKEKKQGVNLRSAGC
jgi:hypothetical protein